MAIDFWLFSWFWSFSHWDSHWSRKKSTQMGRKGRRAKTKTVLKPVNQVAKVGKMQNKDFWKKVKIRIALLEHEYDRNLWQKVKNRSKFHEKWSFFAIILPWRAGYRSERSFLLIFIARDDLVKVSCKFDARKCQNQVTLLTLTGWVKGTSPFSNCQTHKKSWQGQNN